jgi:hypothetical protein
VIWTKVGLDTSAGTMVMPGIFAFIRDKKLILKKENSISPCSTYNQNLLGEGSYEA